MKKKNGKFAAELVVVLFAVQKKKKIKEREKRKHTKKGKKGETICICRLYIIPITIQYNKNKLSNCVCNI